MKMQFILSIIATISVASCDEIAYPCKFAVKVVDELDKPVSNAEVGVSTFLRWKPGQGFGEDVYDTATNRTNVYGEASFSFQSKTGKIGIGVNAGTGYYRSNLPHFKFKEIVAGRWVPDNPTIPYVLKKKRNPIPLYAKNLSEGLLVPVLTKICGYDFEKGDWVPPYGGGAVADIYFLINVKKEPNGDFESSIEVTFPNKKDGLIFFEQNRHMGSELVSDHLAPQESYKPAKTLRRFKNGGKITSEINSQTGNYYLRLRTRLDEKGNIESANYAKIYGDFMYFTYYFNPTPNDRNLEFDPARNLFTNLKSAERVDAP